MSGERAWQVLLIGGASGVGKTMISYRLATHYGAGITEIDDFQVVLEGMTTPEQYPALHFFRTRRDEWERLDEERRLASAIEYATVMARALELVIANHIESRTPIVLEGDFLLPSLAVQEAYGGVPASGQVRALMLDEEDEEQIGRNFSAREGEPQPGRARSSWRYSEWLRREAERLGVPTIPARPWDTVFDRACAIVDSAGAAHARDGE